MLVHEPASAREIEPLMGYTLAPTRRRRSGCRFETLEEAEAYARTNGIPYTVQPPHDPTPKRTSYSDNFRSDRKTPWTH